VAAIGRSPAIDPGQQSLKMHEKEGGIAEGPQALYAHSGVTVLEDGTRENKPLSSCKKTFVWLTRKNSGTSIQLEFEGAS
jgi:hypothetical protein